MGGNLLQGNRVWYLRGGFDCYKAGGSTCPCYAITGEHRFHHAVIGAHRCQSTTPSDLATTLLALDAQVEIAGRARHPHRREAIGDLYDGPGETVLGPTDVAGRVLLARPHPLARSAYEKLALYTGGFAVASVAVAAHVDDDVARRPRGAGGDGAGAVARPRGRAPARGLTYHSRSACGTRSAGASPRTRTRCPTTRGSWISRPASPHVPPLEYPRG